MTTGFPPDVPSSIPPMAIEPLCSTTSYFPSRKPCRSRSGMMCSFSTHTSLQNSDSRRSGCRLARLLGYGGSVAFDTLLGSPLDQLLACGLEFPRHELLALG